MFVCVLLREISDWQRFDALGADLPHAPAGSVTLAYLPSHDHRCAVYVWKTSDFAGLRGWLDGKTAGLSRNEWFQVDEAHAMGLPKIAAHA